VLQAILGAQRLGHTIHQRKLQQHTHANMPNLGMSQLWLMHWLDQLSLYTYDDAAFSV
jgi:hypothetical protein